MAYAALVSLEQTIEKITLNHNQYPISHHRKKQMGSIHEKIILLQRFLDDFPEKANSLEGQITHVANGAEDIFEYFMLEHIQSRFRSTMWTIFPAKFKFIFQLRKIRGNIDSITGKVMGLKNNSTKMESVVRFNDSPAASSSSRLASTSMNNDVVGLQDDLIAIMSRLCGETPKLLVVPIVGMGGIGKTTLARNVYDNPLIMQYFDVRAWVTLSEDDILSGLVVSMKLTNEEISGESNESADEEKVYKSLKGRRYLIVMDDMWSTQAWDDIRNVLPDDGNGSRIMLTTRLSDVAAYPKPSSPLYEMRLMDEDHSWSLLQHKVFPHQDCPPELEDMGKMIAVNCKGLPLAIVVVAGLLSTISKTPTSWGEVAKNINSAVATNNSQFEEILSLSYTHLPHRFRPCFLYMVGFREDHELRVSKLIKLWVAEGFLKCQNESKSLEEEAEECLENLIKRSLVFVRKRKSNGKIKSCSLHDLMRDLFIRKANEEKFLVNFSGGYIKKFHSSEDNKTQRRKKIQRRISTEFPGLPYISQIYGSTIHTIMCLFNSVSVLDYLEIFRLLRVLDAGDAYVRSLPAQLFELFHLRYLAINYIGMIPVAISKLQNLQTLIILGRDKLKLLGLLMNCLPQEIWRMPQLRHLSFRGRLPDPKGNAFALENLQTLSLVSHYMCTEGILKMIPNLKKLEIDCSDYQDGTYLNNLVYLHQLEILELRSSSAVWRADDFVFPRMLKKLTLSGLGLPWNEMTVVGSLANLEVLKLRDHACHGDRWETTEGEFPQLKFLSVENSNLQHWITESRHFPSLKCLALHYCGRLSEIPDVVGEFPLLEVIEVDKWNKNLVKSAKMIQEEQQSFGNDALQVHIGS